MKRLHKLKTDPHILHAYPDIEAHQDAFKIVLHAATNGPEALNKDDIAAFENVFSSTISSFFCLQEGFASIKTIKASKVEDKQKKVWLLGQKFLHRLEKAARHFIVVRQHVCAVLRCRIASW